MSDLLIIGFIVSCLVLVGYRFILKSQVKMVDKKIEEMRLLIDHNKHIVNNNKRTLNQIELGAYQSKEHILWMYSHYKDMLTLLCNVSAEDKEVLDRAAAATRLGMEAVADSFIHTFGVTPEQYIAQKSRMTYTNQLGQSYPAPNAGVN